MGNTNHKTEVRYININMCAIKATWVFEKKSSSFIRTY